MSNLFVPPGTSRRVGQLEQQAHASQIDQGLLAPEASYQQALQNWRMSQMPQMQQGLASLYQAATPAGRNDWIDAYNQWATARARQNAAQNAPSFGGNPDLARSYALDQSNQANQATDQYAANLNSPHAVADAWMAYLRGVQSLSPNYGGLGQLTSDLYGRPAAPVGNALDPLYGAALGKFL